MITVTALRTATCASTQVDAGCRRRAAARRRRSPGRCRRGPAGSASRAHSVARPVPLTSSWSAIIGLRVDLGDVGGDEVALVADDDGEVLGARWRGRRRSRGRRGVRPPIRCRTLGVADFIRVPSPAARTMTAAGRAVVTRRCSRGSWRRTAPLYRRVGGMPSTPVAAPPPSVVGGRCHRGGMATIYYTGCSLDGFIATPDHSLDWLVSRDIDGRGDMGYDTFAPRVGACAMGATTWQWLLDHDPESWTPKPTWVLTHRDFAASEQVRFTSADVAAGARADGRRGRRQGRVARRRW